MKRYNALTRFVIPIALPLTFLACASPARAQGTAFGFQGRLNTNGAAASGLYDFQFSLYGSAENGNPLAASINTNALGVTNGLFSVALDFGPGMFDGAPRWLDIHVRTNGNGAFTGLVPRQPLLATPYSLFAEAAASLPAGAGVRSLNGLHDDINLEAGPNVTLTPNGNTLTIASAGVGGSGIWTLNGSNTYFSAGNVGIGTATPTAALDVRGSVTFETGGSATLYTGTASTELNRYLNLINSPSVPSASGLKAGGILVADSYAFANPGKNDLIVKGRIGVGISPGAQLDVYGSTILTGPLSVSGPLTVGDNFTASIGCADLLIGYSGRRGSPGRALSDLGSTLNINCCGDWATTYVGGGNVSVCSLTIRGGCDLAEPFPTAEQELTKGSVMVIDAEHAGQLRLSTEPYDTRVAGVISGANGINSGIHLHQEGALDIGQDVALTGRVYVQADAVYGPIRPGDLLTTSGTPGHAMKVIDHARAQGAVLGKAMTGLNSGKGMVLVLVTLQ